MTMNTSTGLDEIVKLQSKEIEHLKEKSKELQEQVTTLQEIVFGGRVNHLQRAFKLGIIKEGTIVKYNTVVVKVSVQDGQAILLYENKPCDSFYKFLSSVNGHGQYKKLIIDEISYYDFLNKLKTMGEKTSNMSPIPPPTTPTASIACKTTLFSDSTTTTPLSYKSTDPLFSEIITYFVSRGFQSSLIRPFLKREVHLDLKTNAELMIDFLEERQRLNPTIFIGIEGSGISGIMPGEDKRLLMEWGFTEETANELRDSVCSDILWSKQILYHWVFEWILNPWSSFSQMNFDRIFYDAQFPRNEWNSYNTKGGPQMFASSYEVIATGIDGLLNNNTKIISTTFMNTTYRAFFHATDYKSAQAISKNGIKLAHCKHSLDFGYCPSFYLDSSIDNAIDWIKDRKGFNGIVVYWVNMDKLKSMNYRDLVSEGDDLWKRVVVASRCTQYSEVDDNDFVYGYQLSNPRQILSEWANHGGENVEGSWQNVIPSARWSEPIKHLRLAVKTPKAAVLMKSYCVGVIYFHSKSVDQ